MVSLIESDSKQFVTIQSTLVLVAVGFLLFSSILLGVGSSLGEVNTMLPVVAIAIVMLSAGMTLRKIPANRYTTLILLALVITFMLFLTLLVMSSDLYVQSVTTFTISTIYYMVLGILVAIALAFHKLGRTVFITWEKTKLWRDVFFMAVGVWFVFAMTFYLSIANATPFETTAFLGVPFSAAQVEFSSDIFESAVKGTAGWIEGNFFFTLLLGFVATLGITHYLPTDDIYKRLGAVFLVSVVFGFLIGFLHTGLHDPSQRAVLVYISIFFTAGAVTTLFFETSFAFVMAQGILDFVKSLFMTGNPQSISFAWMVFGAVTLIGIFAGYQWLGGEKGIKKLIK